MNDYLPQPRVIREVPSEWLQLMEVAQRVGYGALTIKINNGKPEMVEMAVKQLKLGLSDAEFIERLRTTPLL